MDLKLSRGHGSMFSIGSSNEMLVVEVLLYKLQFFHSESIFILRIARLNPPQVFYLFGFLGLSDLCVLYFPHYICFTHI